MACSILLSIATALLLLAVLQAEQESLLALSKHNIEV